MRSLFQRGLVALSALVVLSASAADTLSWHTNDESGVSADIQAMPVHRLLEGVAKQTGWHVLLEPGISYTVSAKFQNLPPGEALRLLLGDLNFALVPQTNASPRLYVFRSSRGNATEVIRPDASSLANSANAKRIDNELVVRIKPGANIDEIARELGAKVLRRIPGLNAYLLEFSDAAAADAARQQLADNSDVANIDYNYVVDPPPSALRLQSAGVPPVQLKLAPPDSSGRVIVGLVDTAVQPLGGNLDSFLLKSLSVAGESNADPNSPTHGTSMFENILRAAEATSGGSSSMQVVSVDVYGPNATTSTFDVAAGIVAAVNNGANIINLSLGSPGESQLLHDLIQQVTQKGIPVFAAAGNDGSPEAFYPAAYPEVTSVTAGTQGKPAPYANYGQFINLIAPGSSVVYFGNTAYLVSGTSTATALVSGTVAATAASKQVPISDVVTAIRNSPSFQFVPSQ